MGHTIAEKIISAHLMGGREDVVSGGQPEVWPGDLVEVTILCNDVTAPIAIREFEKLGVEGTAATVRVLIDMQDETRLWTAVGASINIIEASWIALTDAVEYGLTVAG